MALKMREDLRLDAMDRIHPRIVHSNSGDFWLLVSHINPPVKKYGVDITLMDPFDA